MEVRAGYNKKGLRAIYGIYHSYAYMSTVVYMLVDKFTENINKKLVLFIRSEYTT